jgi:hypothetical protein
MRPSAWSRNLDDPGIWAPVRVGVRRLIGRYGGYLALSVAGLFWLFVYGVNRWSSLTGPLMWVPVPLYVLYVTPPLGIPVIGWFASRNARHGEQSPRSGVIQMALALVASAVSCWTIGAGHVELS